MKKFYILYLFSALALFTKGATKTSTGSGNWNSSGAWSPSGVPSSSDDVIIQNGHSYSMNSNPGACKSLTINSGGTLTFTNRTLTISGAAGLTVNGTLTMAGGDITLSTSGATFAVGSSGSFTWEPTSSGATLWTNGVENFAATSTITIKKWHNYNTPLGSVVTGNFGNLIIDYNYSTSGVWYQNNSFQTHLIQGTLTINRGYILLDNTNSISNTTIGNIVLNGTSAYLDFYNGTHSSSFIVSTGSINIASGWLDCYYLAGTGNCTLNVSGDVTIGNSGKMMGNDLHSGSNTMNIGGNFTNNGGEFYGTYTGNGNSTMNITGNFYNLRQTYDADFYSIYNGNGNAILNVGGNLTNNCYMDLIWNPGTTGVGNGNGTLTVGGTYFQSDGDFRGVYNLTTYNAGSVTMNFGNIDFTGGIFMAYYACNTAGATNSITVTGNVSINFALASNVFRLNALNILGTTTTTSNLNFTIGGNLSVNGSGNAEFRPSGSGGTETITIGGNTTLSGGTAYFQGNPHSLTFNNTGNFTVSNGATAYLSYSTTASTTTIGGNLSVTGGVLAVKGNIGSATLNVNGDFTLSGGNFYLHNNSTVLTTNTVTANVYGAFTHSGGVFRFDDNDLSTAEHILNIYGSSYSLTNNTAIKRDGTNASLYFGIINFARNGTITYNRTDNNHDLQRVKQYIKNGTTLDLASDMQLAAHGVSSYTQLTVESGGNLNINNYQLKPNTNAAYSGMIVKDGGSVRLKKAEGLWDNTLSSAVRKTIDYYLEPSSIIEYNGNADQMITGYGYGTATTNNQKYGILVINNSNTASRAYLNSAMNVRTRLQMTEGQLDLNGNTLTVESGATSAITRTNGYIKSETNSATNNSILKWKSLTSGAHVYPFGYSSTEYIPVTITPTAGIGNDVSISTRATSTANNTPLPTGVTNLSSQGTDVSATAVIDRWWNITATGVTADVILSYRGAENSTIGANATGTFSIQAWTGTTWSAPFGSITGVTSGIGSINASGVSTFGNWVMGSSSTALPIELISFIVKPKDDLIEIKWATAAEENNDYFSIERSGDGRSFEVIEKIDGAGNSNIVLNYRTTDANPLQGKSYYRLKQTDFNGDFSYSPVRVIDRDGKSSLQSEIIDIKSVAPNPFTNQFSVTYNLEKAGEVEIMLISMNGQIMISEKIQAEAGVNYYDYKDERNIPVGNYIIAIVSGDKKASKKIVKSNN